MALTAKKVYAILKRQISDMEAKLNSPVRYRGTVATADLLPLNPDIGDMYNIESKSVYGEAGMNVAWNGVVWDTMGAPIDMSLYLTKEEAETVMQRLVTEYFEKNPVKPGATTEQAQQIEQNKTDIASLKTETGSLKEDLEGFKGSSFTASEQYSENVLDNDNGVMEGWNAKVPVYLKKNIRYLIGVANSTALNPGVAINIIDESGSLLQVVKQDYTQIPTNNGVPFESTIDGKFYMLFKFIEGGITAWKKFMVIKAPQESVAWAEKDFVPFSYKKTYTANIAEKANQIQSRYYDKTHLSFGDSITEQAVWQSYFRKYLGTKMELIKGYSGQALWKNCSEQSLEEKLGNTQFDFATVMFGTNDWGQSRQIGSNSDTNDNGEYTGTFKGSLNTFFKNMTTKFPSKPFIMVTPPNGFEDLDYNNKPFSDNGRKNLLGLSIKDYADAIKELSAMWGIPCFDFNSVCGWNYINKSIYLKSEPNGTYIHPNGVGGQEYAYKLARFCEMN